MRRGLAIIALGLAVLGLAGEGAAQTEPVTIRVDTTVTSGPMHPFWAWFGHDEPNYTYTPNGKKLLSALQALSPVPVFMRVHNLLTSGDGTHALKWGSTNVYTEDANGKPVYDWTILDRIVDTYMDARDEAVRAARLHAGGAVVGAAGHAVPALLEAGRSVQRHLHRLDVRAEGLQEVGGALLPGDAAPRREVRPQRSRELVVRALERARHRLLERLGRAERGRGDPLAAQKAQTRRDEFNKLYDFTVEGVRRALPTARIGGPEVTGGAQAMLRTFLQHTSAGTNYATGQDRHAARPHHLPRQGQPDVRREPRAHGRGQPASQHRRPLRRRQASSRCTRRRRIVIGESDPEGCAACGVTPLSAERLSQRHDVPDLHGAADRAHLRTGRPAPGEPARRRHAGRSSSRTSRTSTASAIWRPTASTSRC